jgi:hypothetical protein
MARRTLWAILLPIDGAPDRASCGRATWSESSAPAPLSLFGGGIRIVESASTVRRWSGAAKRWIRALGYVSGGSAACAWSHAHGRRRSDACEYELALAPWRAPFRRLPPTRTMRHDFATADRFSARLRVRSPDRPRWCAPRRLRGAFLFTDTASSSRVAVHCGGMGQYPSATFWDALPWSAWNATRN